MKFEVGNQVGVIKCSEKCEQYRFGKSKCMVGRLFTIKRVSTEKDKKFPYYADYKGCGNYRKLSFGENEIILISSRKKLNKIINMNKLICEND